MYPYKAPIQEMDFLLTEVFEVNKTWKHFSKLSNTLDTDTALAILSEASKLSTDLINPLNRNSDEQGAFLTDKKVTTPDGFQNAYKEVAAGGWVGLCGNDQYGGMGMPKMLGVLTDEMFYSASNSFSLYNSLTSGAALCIDSHGSDFIKNKYLPKMYSGEWSGAMAMTEAHAGSDLRHLKTTAKSMGNNQYSITGSKIFITAGEHDLTENIIHLVLAKIVGQESLSLFVAPKFMSDVNGVLTDYNHISVGSIEHKMGLHGSATCVMNYDESTGYLVGQEGKGLACMFTMMNYERLAIGIQGLANSEYAYQMAASYAKDRMQGSSLSSSNELIKSSAIINHGDIRRSLLTIRCITEAGRALSLFTANQLDLSKFAVDDAQTKGLNYSLLLTPITKAFFTDRGLESAITAQQVFGGHGYIRESGIEQIVRDTRIAQIYEGTNGIQALDFLGRKVVKNKQATLKQLFCELSENMQTFKNIENSKCEKVTALFEKLIVIAENITKSSVSNPNVINSCAVNYLDATAYALYGYFWLLMQEKSKKSTKVQYKTKQVLCDFYFDALLPKSDFHMQQLLTLDGVIMNLSADQF